MYAFPHPRRLSLQARRGLFIASLCALTAFRALGLNPSHRLSQYGHTAWRIQDGVFSGTPTSIAQTKDGYIWIGTRSGLLRFDGVRFTPFRPSTKENLRSSYITSLLAAQDGSLWIGTGSHVAHFKDGDITNYLDVVGTINALRQGKDGSVWFSRSRVGADESGGVCRIVGPKIHCYGKAEGMPVRTAQPLQEGDASDWWIGGEGLLVHWNEGSSTIYAPEALRSTAQLIGFTALAKAPDGSIWAGMQFPGEGLGLQHLVNGQLTPFIVQGLDSSDLEVNAVLFDRDHSMWVGTEGGGVYRITGSLVEHFGAADGLSSDTAFGFFEDREGNVWVTTSKGVDKFRDLKVITYSKVEGLAADEVNSVVAARDGTIWVGAVALSSIQGTTISSIKSREGLPGRQVTSLLEDRGGKLLVGIDDKLFVRDHGGFNEVKGRGGQSVGGVVEKLVSGFDGSVWAEPITIPRKLVHIVNYQVAEETLIPDGRRPLALATEPNGDLLLSLQGGDFARYHSGKWDVIAMHRPTGTGGVFQFVTAPYGVVLGTSTFGIVGWRDGRTQDLTADNGLPCSRVYSLVWDSEKALWLYTACGLVKIDDSELRRWWHNPRAKIKCRSFDSLDGAQPAPPDFQTPTSMSPDGKLWFANGSVLQQIDPLHISTNIIVPPVHIEEIIADKKEYPLNESSHLPPLTREVQINYNALSFVIPERVQFRYRLEGWESDWQDAGTRRQAFYTNLRPATYRFHVIACNDDGLWNDVGDVLTFTIVPAYYQTRWFQVLCAIVFAGMLWALYLFRLKQATSHIQERLGAQMEERERIARELHDTLLQGFHGIMLRFQAVTKILPAEGPAREMMGKVLDRADEVLLEGRESVRDLRESGMFAGELSAMLTSAGEELAQDTSMLFSLVVVGDPRTLDLVAHKEIYRIAREALSNAFQHSHAAKIEVEMTYDNSGCSVRIRDDGSGIDSVILSAGKEGHWGLSGMRERAKNLGAQLNIWSKSGAGTEIEMTVPAIVAYPRGPKRSIWHLIRNLTKGMEREG